MPTVQGTDTDFTTLTVPGSGPYAQVDGTPVRDTTIIPSGWNASLLIEIAGAIEGVQYAISGSPTLPWHGFFFDMESADEPAANTLVAGIKAADGADGRLDYQPSNNRFYHYIAGGSSFPVSPSITFGTFVWVEQILDTGSGTRTLYTRVGGTDLTSATRVVAASTGTRSCMGSYAVSATLKCRYANVVWGTASSTTDFLGQPSPLVTGQTILPDADNAAGGWTTTPLFSKINDSSDATIITSTAA